MAPTSLKISQEQLTDLSPFKGRLPAWTILLSIIATLVDGQVSAGEHEVRFDTSNLSNGIHIYRIRTNNFVETRQMTLIK